ncbi:hypothetical protein FHR36_002434 [Kitasatospora paracochleata]|uniref:Uncharacterized protein n=1 Tax=Kitasatospora paracochleata TaxID=58354 RepID=A0ABT1IVY8_9ACTN|nr:hypothetical protein [Kitasatospora paracochleata]
MSGREAFSHGLEGRAHSPALTVCRCVPQVRGPPARSSSTTSPVSASSHAVSAARRCARTSLDAAYCGRRGRPWSNSSPRTGTGPPPRLSPPTAPPPTRSAPCVLQPSATRVRMARTVWELSREGAWLFRIRSVRRSSNPRRRHGPAWQHSG